MQSDRHLELDMRDPLWTEGPGDIMKAVFEVGPGTVTIRATEAGMPTALSAQLLTVLRRHVEACGGRFDIPDPSAAFVEGLTLLGLRDAILAPEGVQQ